MLRVVNRMTVKQAAESLGVSERRVCAMIRSGILTAARFGRDWAIEAESVEERKRSGARVGRPKKEKAPM